MDSLGFHRDLALPEISARATMPRMVGRPSRHIVNPPNRIREVREGLVPKMTQKDLAHAIGVTPATVQKYETGDAEVGVHQLRRIARALGTKSYMLMPDYDPAAEAEERAVLEVLRRLSPRERRRARLMIEAAEQAEAELRRHSS